MASSSDILFESCRYRGEGNSSLVVSLRLDNEDKVLRLLKHDASQNLPVNAANSVHSKKVQRASCCSSVLQDSKTVLKTLENFILFIKNVMRPLLGDSIVPLPDLISVSAEDIKDVVNAVKNCRPSHRCHRGMVTCNTHALVLPDFCSGFQQCFSGYPTVGPALAFEIKTKRGFVKQYSDHRLLSKPGLCTYCMMQYFKEQKGTISERSKYCPLDLYSGCPSRMKQAVFSLFDSPQNNFRLFKDKELIYSEEQKCNLSAETLGFFAVPLLEQQCKEALAGIIIDALLRPLPDPVYPNISSRNIPQKMCSNSSPNCSESGKECHHTLPKGCILDRMLAVQLLDDCDIIDLHLFYQTLKETVPDSADSVGVLPRCTIPCNFAQKSCMSSETRTEYISRKVWEFLTALILKDCSIMITFKRLDPVFHIQRSESTIVTGNDGTSYIYSMVLIDLDMKDPVKVEKVYTDTKHIIESYIHS